ncbi:MAG: hypothetical protein WD512_20450 [Candidatus Paceibacterota bacterium]
MDTISGNALWGSIKRTMQDFKLTDKEKIERIETALEVYKSMNK